MTAPARLLMLGLDAMDRGVVEQMTAAGRLPRLRRLREAGIYRPLESPADSYAGGVWPTFYTGSDVAQHGLYHNKQWRQDKMRVEVPTQRWMPIKPLWELEPYSRLRTCIVDVPMLLARGRGEGHTYLGGWGTHDLLATGSLPGSLWRDLKRRFGTPKMPRERYGRQTEASYLGLHRALSAATEQFRGIGARLLTQVPWQFACLVLGTTHRAGHYLWNRSQLAGHVAAREEAGMSPEMASSYEAADAALGELAELASEDTLVVTFAVHGTALNPGWSDLFPDMLERVLALSTGRPPKRGTLYKIRRRLPFHWVRPILVRLPTSMTDWLVTAWSRNMLDWRSARWFAVPMDEAGYLRINLRGRESRGIVEPGAQYDEVCREIEQLVAGLRRADTGQPIVGKVIRAYQEADPDAPGRDRLPDLVVTWQGPPATRTAEIVCDALPSFVYAVPKPLPSGRSGNHTAGAWFIARGPGARDLEGVTRVADLLPAALRTLSNGMES